MSISPILLAKAFIIMAFVGAFKVGYDEITDNSPIGFIVIGTIMGAIIGALTLGIFIATVEALIFLFT